MFGSLTGKPGKSPWGSYRDKFLQNYFRGLARPPPALPKKRGSYRKGALTRINSSRFIFGALAGISGKCPGGAYRIKLFSNCFGLKFPNAVVLNAAGRRNTQIRAKTRKLMHQKNTKGRKRARLNKKIANNQG